LAKKEKPFNNPFAEMGKALKRDLEKQKAKPLPPPAPPPKPRAAKEEDDAALWQKAMAGLARVDDDRRGKTQKPLPPPNAEHLVIFDEDAEVLAQLASLVEGTGTFDIADTDEYIEGAVDGLDRRILKRLRRGDFALDDEHLDLHGLTREPARQAVEEYIARMKTKGARCVLIVHGRGLNSKDQIPVLKEQLKTWLAKGRLARHILAFATARPHDGGAGAVYVLLRR
jgi:DNA-nicking Smr family endonuclease